MNKKEDSVIGIGMLTMDDVLLHSKTDKQNLYCNFKNPVNVNIKIIEKVMIDDDLDILEILRDNKIHVKIEFDIFKNGNEELITIRQEAE